MDPKSSFGARVRELRTKKGWSQERLAAEAKLDRTYIGGIERGERNPSLVNIYRLAKALNVSVRHLLLSEGINMAKYIDSGSGQADQCLGHWFDANVLAGIQEFRCQFGYFRYSAIEPFADVIRDLAAAGGQVHFVLGSNFGSLIAADAQLLLRVAAGKNASLTIVAFADAKFHANTVHLMRRDGSITAVVGSSNLTLRGLGQNVEAGVIFDSRASDPTDQLEQIRNAIDFWRDVPSNAVAYPEVVRAVFPINDDDDLRDLVERRIINLPQPSTETMRLTEWSNGYCSVFAVALHQIFGGEIWAIVHHLQKTGEEFLCHCYCVVDGVAYDESGAVLLEEASDTDLAPIHEADRKYDGVTEWKKVDEDWFAEYHDDFDAELIPEANRFILAHPKRFPRAGNA
jgi:transcriptional regulator with XRE-family HTH domain